MSVEDQAENNNLTTDLRLVSLEKQLNIELKVVKHPSLSVRQF
jgi:hypothetical protein